MIRKFLLVDDDSDDTDLFEEAIRNIDESIELHTAPNCKDILKLLKDRKLDPEIIFLDINMPGMDGWECLSVLKNDKDLRQIPIVMYSTSSVNIDGQRALKQGALGFLEKPSSFLVLKDFLAKISAASTGNLETELRKIQASKSHRLLVA
jgi:CheY-like chemotaxis protein